MRNARRRFGRILIVSAALVALPLTLLCGGAAAATSLLFDATSSLNSGTIPYPYQSFVPGHVTVTSDPLGGPNKVMRFAVADSDRPYSGATNPRADFETASYFANGADRYAAIKFLIPAGFPTLTSSGWFQIAEIYGPPHGGSPTIGIDLRPGAGGRPQVVFQRDASHGYDHPWVGPSLDDRWHTIYLHVKMATDNTGFVQLWFDGKLQTMSTGTTQINYPTLVSGLNWNGTSPNILNVNQYRRAGSYPGTVVTYHAAAKVGTTLNDVVDASTPPPAAPAPLAAVFAAPSTAKIGQQVTFDASASTGSPASYTWTDGTNTLGTGKMLPFTFHHAGTKHVKLTVTDAAGKTSSVTHDLVVS